MNTHNKNSEIVFCRHFLARPATPEDVPPIAANLRVGDRLELERWCDEPAEALLRESLGNSLEAWTAVAPDDQPVAMWGVAPFKEMPGCGRVWLMGTDRIHESLGDFLWLSRHYDAIMCRHYAVVGNLVDAEYAQALRWLHWLGYKEDGEVRSPKGHRYLIVLKATA